MKIYKIVYLFIVCSLGLIQPAIAALAPSWEQRVIVIDHLSSEGEIVALDGTNFEVTSPEVTKQGRVYKKQSVHVLYVNMGDKYVASKLKPATEPPFEIPTTKSIKKSFSE